MVRPSISRPDQTPRKLRGTQGTGETTTTTEGTDTAPVPMVHDYRTPSERRLDATGHTPEDPGRRIAAAIREKQSRT